ncbi:MAG: hypothetical protein ACRCWQ_10870 [Bacilli bacterium]
MSMITLKMAQTYIGKTVSAMGFEMSDIIDMFGGTGASKKPLNTKRGKVSVSTLKACGLDIKGKQSGAGLLILKDITFVVYHRTMYRDFTVNAHEITILGIANDEGKVMDRKAYNRVMVEITKKMKAEQDKRMQSLLDAVCEF